MVRVDEVLAAIRRGIEQSGRMPTNTSYRERQFDVEGVDAGVTLPAVLLTEVTTTRDQNRSTDLVGVVRDTDTNQVIGRIFEVGFEMVVQIDVYVVSGQTPDVSELAHRVRRALQQYDSQLRADLFPDGAGGTVGEIQHFTLEQGQPIDDLSQTPSLRRQRLSASVMFTDRLNEVDEYGPTELIHEVRTPRDGDYAGGLSDDYELVYYA